MMNKLLALFGIWLHKRKTKHTTFYDMGNEERVAMECGHCGTCWGWDR